MPRDFHGFTASVWSNAKQLEEYDQKVEGNTVKVYIESKNGQQFEVRWRAVDPTIALTDDEEQACFDEDTIKGLGTIELRFHRYRKTGHCYAGEYWEDIVVKKQIHEQSKKATLSHSVELGPAQIVPPRSHISGHYIDPHGRPRFTIQFIYRSRDLLEILGIIKPLPAPEPSSSSNNNANPMPNGANRGKKRSSDTASQSGEAALSEAELRAEVARLRAENARLKDPEVKTEPAAKRVKKEKVEKGGQSIIIID